MFELFSDCQFCQVAILKPTTNEENQVKKSQHDIIFSRTLYQKYSASQNYFYTRDLNQILGNVRSVANINHVDAICYDDVDEYLKRYYQTSEFQNKVDILSEFYKFHKDIPRWTIQRSILKILNYFYDKKRRISYYKIQLMINADNNNNPDQPARGIVGERPYESQCTQPSQTSYTMNANVNLDNILQEITIQQSQTNSFYISPALKLDTVSQPKDQRFLPITSSPTSLPIIKSNLQMINLLSVKTIKGKNDINIETKNTVQFSTDVRIVKPIKVIEKTRLIKKAVVPFAKTYSYSLHAQIVPRIQNLTPSSVASPTKYPEKNQNFFRKEPVIQQKLNQVRTQNISPSKLQSSHHFQVKPSKVLDTNVAKKKSMFKKSLKLDDVALSTSTKNTADDRVYQSARYQIFNQYKPLISMQQPKSTSREPPNSSLKEKQLKRLSKKQIDFKAKTPVSKIIDQMSSRYTQSPYYPFQSNKASVNQLPSEVKKLELKVMQGLQDIQKRKHCNSFNQQSILLNYQQKQKKQSYVKFGDSSSQFDSLNFSHQHRQSPRVGLHVPASTSRSPTKLLKKLELGKLKYTMSKHFSFYTSSFIEKKVKSPQKTDRQEQRQQSVTQRHNSLYPVTPRIQIINNMMQWQIKAIQAATKDKRFKK